MSKTALDTALAKPKTKAKAIISEAEVQPTPLVPAQIVEVAPPTLDQKARNENKAATDRRMSCFKILSEEDKVMVRIAPSYAARHSKMMNVAINGIIITVPCDGKNHLVPESYAAIIYQRLKDTDRYEQKQQRMANVQHNAEQYAGQLTL